MELNKKNLKSILNNFIAGVTLVLVAIFVALCFVNPSRVQGASTLTKEDIKAYNIYFVSALTKNRAATGIEKVYLTGRNESNSPYTFYAHQYDYNDYLTSENLFYGKSSNVVQDDVNGNISVMTSTDGSSPLSEKVFIPLESGKYKNHYGFIPYGANYFNNVAGAKELIFYNEINNNDYVLLDNYELNGSNTDKFNVENFYLSFGTPYIDDYTTTPLNELKVSAKLYSEGRVHNIVLNDVLETKVDSGDQSKDIYYWNQYFDLKNLSAYITTDPNSDTYAIENQQGRYEFTFKFVRYNSSFDAENMPEEEFTYSFYLLDSADYTNYPTINNATIVDNEIPTSGTEYFYNFTTDNPYVNYDPTRYNLSYTRKNNKSINNIFETITSTFVQETYSKDGKTYPKGILTYYNGSDIVKQVFILTQFNSDRSVVEHLYLSRTNPTTTFNLAEYQSFVDSVKSDTLKFEYKTTTILTKAEQNINITDYRTNKYENFELIADNIDSINENIATLKDGKTVELENATSVDYTIINDSEIKLKDSTSSIIKYDTQVVSDELIGSINSGIIANTNTLAIKNDAFDEGQSNDTKLAHTKYKLSSDSTSGDTIYTIAKTYYEYDTTGETVTEKNLEDFAIIQMNTYEDGTYEIVDSIHKNITIKYVVESKAITSIKLYINDKVDVLSVNSNQHELKTLLGIKENSGLSLDYTYDLVLDELGIYEFTYSYVSYTDKHYINSTNPRNVTTLSSLSSNYTAPVNYSKIVKADTTDDETLESKSDNNKLYIVVSTEVKDTKFNLLGKEYKYNAGDTYFTDLDNNQYNFNAPKTDDHLGIPVEYKLNTANGYIVEAYFEVGSFSKTTNTTTYTHLFQGKEYRKVSTTQISTNYSISVNDDTIASLKSDSAFKSFGETLERLKAFDDTHPFTTSETITSEPKQGYAKMHIFGSIAYFSKTDVHSDSNYSKLEQIDSKLGVNYISDVTSKFVTTHGVTSPSEASKNKTKIASLLTKDEIIVTDVTPILWNNFSTLCYSGKTSLSYVYRYSKWHYDESGYVIPDGTPVTSTYTKDIYCQRDGLYEVIVFYTYDNMPTQEAREKVYFQVFTFIIDNKPPKIEIDVKNDDGNYKSLDLNNYTNKDVRISWDIPSYFKHDVYLEVNKEYYNDSNTTDNFNATFKQLNTIVNTGNATYVNGISEMKALDKKYYVYLQLDSPSLSYSMNGNYEVILHYGTNGRSTYSEDFIIDKMNIDGLTIESVMKNDDGTYKKSSEDIGNSQITNKNFTFRFNSKASGADIFVYYDKIELASSDGYDKLIDFTSGQGITTKYEVQGYEDDLSEGTPYVYEYTHERIGEDKVDNKNVLTSNTSCLFLFRLEDEAGNTARFVVFYDKTEPRFLTSPEPDPDTKIINDTTRVVWGDYKAIKISTDVEIDDSAKFDNYKKLDENTEKLNIVLGYLRHYTNNFNSIKVEKYNNDYYLLIPITEVRIEDRDYLSDPFDPLKNGNIKDYYFFPTNPIDNDQITLPNYVDGKVDIKNGAIQTTTYTVASSSTENVLDNYGNPIERYITIEYYPSGNTGSTATIKGVIGEGKFFYAVYDKIENKTTGLLWMNLDKTETLAYATFDYTDKISKAEELIGKEVTSSASSLFISSLVAKQNEIPQYEVTGKYYPYDANLYKDYSMTAIDIEQDGEASYLKINMVKKSDSSIKKEVKLQLTDEYGTDYPIHSYPYSLDGTSLASDSKGNPVDIYSKGSQFKGNDTTRKYSLALNTNTDTERQSLVTQEGLYILKRTYTDPNLTEEMLGSDQRVIYRVYYIDRSGIINISANNSAGNKLYSIGQDIQFTLGATQDPSYHKVITAETIQNNQSKTSQSNTSNADYTSSNQFDTNKIQVEFNLTYDKYNFSHNVSNSNSLLNQLYNKSLADETSADLKTYLNGYLLNTAFYQNKYKIDLQLSVGDISDGDVVINESEQKYNTNAINHYLKNNPMINLNTRGNDYNFYLDTNPSLYYIGMKDQAGYELFNEDGTVKDKNYLANSLKITFDISHTPPVGNAYGKYYGRQNYEVITDGSSYELLKYLEEGNGQKGQLELLSETLKHTESSKDGYYAQLLSTNNETLVFAFAITNDEFQAKIDHKNIKIYKGSIDEKNLIFNRVNGDFVDTTLVKKERQKTSFIENEVNGTTYYAIIIFDNNLDDIVDPNDPIEKEYLNFRLLDREDNLDKEKYFVKINYIGNSGDYIGQDGNANEISYYNTTYDITIDRIKPTYNLTKLMNLDKYVYNTIEALPSISNYETLFESYKPFYNFSLDAEQDFERSDLEKYFFALDTRKDSEFVFESIDDLDNSKNIYIRQVDKNNYKFSVTPDDYKAYYNATYLQGYPQFTPSNAELIEEAKLSGSFSLDPAKYYRIAFDLDNAEKRNSDTQLSTNFLKNHGILRENTYYEIIESDEAGNYRVYGIYVPQESKDEISYSYQTNSNVSSTKIVNILNQEGNTPYVTSSGMALKFLKIKSYDNFLKAKINILTEKIDHDIEIILDPNNLIVTVINRTTNTTMNTYEVLSNDKDDNDDGFANTEAFITAINDLINYYNELINDKNHSYYSEYGYNVTIHLINRIGVSMKDTTTLYNYEINYVVAGSTLYPTFTDYATNFTMKLDGQKGSTYLTDITVYKFNKVWSQINSDNSPTPQIFDKSDAELKKEIIYTFNRGIYRFVFTDNFGRVNEFFYEYGISSSQTGGSLSYAGSTSTMSDGYIYSSNNVTYTYDSSVYNIYIKFVGKVPNEFGEYDIYTDEQNQVIYSSNISYTPEYLAKFGIKAITSGNTTTITFSGVKDNSKANGTIDLSKYHIKTILASTSTNYNWNDENKNTGIGNDNASNNKDVFVYDKQIAIYKAVPNANIKNLSGNILDTREHLNLTEDIELITTWSKDVATNERFGFNPRILLTRTYNDNGTIRTTTTRVESGYTITLPGDYTAYTVNDLGSKSATISFTRGEGEISMYAVYAVNSQMSSEKKLNPSTLIDNMEYGEETKVLFTYFITNDYFKYKDSSSKTNITIDNLLNNDYSGVESLSTIFVCDTSANKYLDVRVNSNLSIKAEIYEVGIKEQASSMYPYVTYMIYSTTKAGEIYVYRFIQVVFVEENPEHGFADTTLTNQSETNNLAETTSLISSTADTMYLTFKFGDEYDGLYLPQGDTVYIDRYYNGNLVETYVIDMSIHNSLNAPTFEMLLNQVGLHEFVIRDLAGRTHKFHDSEKLQIYLINEILFTVNDNSPINNQVFNGNVDIDIVFKLDTLQLYNQRSLNIVVTKNGQVTNMPNSSGQIQLTEPGYYSITMSAIVDGTSTQVSTIYNFVILDEKIANNTFSISKGTGFAIEKLIKIVNGEETDITDTYSVSNGSTTSNLLLWLTHSEQGNSIFDVTLKYYDSVTDSDMSFNFRIWINNESPVFISSVPAGTKTKDSITVHFNPGLIYTQIGKGYITLNDTVISTIDENSQSVVETISIEEKGTYWIRLYSNDGTLIDTYKFTKQEPMNKMTKIIIIVIVIVALVVVGLFFFLRRKGRYR